MAELQAQAGSEQALSEPAAASSPPVVPLEGSHPEASSTTDPVSTDIAMVDAPAPADHASPAPSIQPPLRTGTPSRANGAAPEKEPGSSRANSVHPEPKEPLPDQAAEHGEPVRRYLNSKVAGALLEGMRIIAKEKPNDPLRVLGEFLIKRQEELDSAGTT